MHATFASAFLRGDPGAAGFLCGDFRDAAARARAAHAAAARSIAPSLLAELQAQAARLPESASRRQSLAALASPGTAVVVTGQQVGLFLGPLYTVYKAASAVAVARALARETGVPCVPLFWLQTEDHDFDEIRACQVPCPGAPPLRLELPPGPPELARVSVAHRTLAAETSALLDSLGETIAGLPHAEAALALWRAHYQPGRPLADAFAGVLAELFADDGLLILNPRCAAVAALAAPIHRQALVEQGPLAAALCEHGEALRSAGYAEQVPPRPRTTLLFFHDGGIEGPRSRLERREHGWAIPAADGERVFTESELLAVLASEPLRFSSSALLRPIVQDSLLPTAAYVGGPGEISYCAQLLPLYARFGVPQPLVVPRGRFRILDDNTRALLDKLGLVPADAEQPREGLLHKLAARAPDENHPAAVRDRVLAEMARPLDALAALDPSLRDPVRRAHETVERTVLRLVERYEKALQERDHVICERVDRLQSVLFPGGAPQERVFSLPYFACRYGADAFLARVRDGLAEPFATGVRDLVP